MSIFVTLYPSRLKKKCDLHLSQSRWNVHYSKRFISQPFLLLCENMNTEDVFMYVCMCVHLFASLFHRLFVWRQ